jgi:hypothetical protein
VADVTTSPLRIEGQARLIHMNARKEGPEDAKVLATDLKLALTVSNDILISFHPQLRLMLFTKEGEPRFPQMGAIDWDYEFRQMSIELDPATLDAELHFHGVTLKKWTITPRKAGKVELTFQAQIHPDRYEFGALGKALLAEEVNLRAFNGNGDLFETRPTKGQEAARAAAAIRNEEPELPLEPPAEKPAPEPEPEPQPEPQPQLELTAEHLMFFRTAGKTEAANFADERDFDTGLANAMRSSGLPKEFIEDHRVEIDGAYTDGYEEELRQGE